MSQSRGVVVWFTGLPSSGKSTLAGRVRHQLAAPCVVLDSDAIRDVLEADSYGGTDRDAFYRVLGRLAALLAHQGHVVLVAATAPSRSHREAARAAAPRFIEVWVRTPLETCAARDSKGLYARARAGIAPTLPGVGTSYEVPLDPEVTAEDGLDDAAVTEIKALTENAHGS